MDDKFSDDLVIDNFVNNYKWPEVSGSLKGSILNRIMLERMKESNWKDVLYIVFSKSYPLMIVMIVFGSMFGTLSVPQTHKNTYSSVYDNTYFLSAEMGVLYNKGNARD